MYAGIDVGGTNVKLAIVTARGRVARRGVIDTRPSDGPSRAFARIRRALDSLARPGSLRAAGVGCAGLFDIERGVLRASPNLKAWENRPLVRIAERAFGVYTTVDNDATSAVWGEHCCGKYRGASDLIFITLGTGIGGGIIAGDRIVRGVANYGGEIGHMTVDPDGPRCHCGNRGCLEAFAGSYGMLRRTRELMRSRPGRYLSRWVERDRRRLTPELLALAARRGDGTARAVFRETGAALGTAIATLVNLFNPEGVLMGGGVAASFDLLRPHVERQVRRRAFAEPAARVHIEPSILGNDATAVGAAMFARDGARGRR